jgi:hypothetical protein
MPKELDVPDYRQRVRGMVVSVQLDFIPCEHDL